MPTATERRAAAGRRRLLRALPASTLVWPAVVLPTPAAAASAATAPAGSAPAASATAAPQPRSRPLALLAAAWDGQDGHRVGLLKARAGAAALEVSAEIDVPTRAHALYPERDGQLLAVARRPGDWLLRWRRDGREVAWHWAEPDRVFNGHVIASPDGRRVFTTETDLEDGRGLIGVRDARTLAKLAEWPTYGMDPHELLWTPPESGPLRLVVANGGIPTQAETGRRKLHLDRMDSSLVMLNPRDGMLAGQWRLPDPRLSLRHLAWHRGADAPPVLGIALQAEHDDDERRRAAPVLAVFDGRRLRSCEAERSLAGYGGQIVAAGGGFVVSCPRSDGIAMWSADGRWRRFQALAEACPLAVTQAAKTPAALIWAGGRHAVRVLGAAAPQPELPAAGLRLDNHWAALPASADAPV
ncbi:MAG: DUF1513 domain-containing protein [Burkholderiaceae bacterium]